MSKLTLNNVGNLIDATTAATTINDNSAAIVAAMENTLSRDGTSPNQMESDLDMNSNKILNLPKATSDTEPLRKKEFDEFAITGNLVDSVNGQVGDVVLDADDIDDSTTTHKFTTASDIARLANTSGTNTGDQTNITGNAATATLAASATKLQTARNINGVAFDGTADITVADSTKVPTTTTVNGHALSSNVTVTKSDVGLGNVDNTSDATKNSAVATLTNKTLTAPVINSPTGIVKADVGLGNVDNTSDATKNSAVATLTNKTLVSPVLNSPTMTTPSLGVATATSINGVSLDNNAWTSYTPTVTANTGTFTSVSATGAYKTIGKTVFFRQNITITTVGTASGSVNATLPTGVSGNCVASGRFSNDGKALSVSLTGSPTGYSFSTLYDGTFPFTNGSVLSVSGVYESS